MSAGAAGIDACGVLAAWRAGVVDAIRCVARLRRALPAGGPRQVPNGDAAVQRAAGQDRDERGGGTRLI